MFLLLGATGYVGQAFAAEMRRRGLDFVGLSRQTLDYTRFDVLFGYVRSARPEFVINAAGFTGGADRASCDVNRAEAVRGNTLLPQTIARVCYLANIPWGHISSGNIFAGAGIDTETGSHPPASATVPRGLRGFSETDEPNATFRFPPADFYSGTKALAEESLRWTTEMYIWRPGLMFDQVNHPRNFLSQLQQYATVPNRVVSLSHRADFVRACLDLQEIRAPHGTYHVANPGPVMLQELAKQCRAILRGRDPSDQNIAEVRGALDQADCVLEISRLQSAGIRLRPAAEAVRSSLEQWEASTSQNFPVKS